MNQYLFKYIWMLFKIQTNHNESRPLIMRTGSRCAAAALWFEASQQGQDLSRAAEV